ncbi:MAG: helix-turn-helix transcriptional regulator [Pseudomonadota bacterium]
MANSELLSSAIGSIYEAAYKTAAWDAAVASLQTLFDGSKTCLGKFGPDLHEDDVVATNVDPVFQRRYLGEYAYQPDMLFDAISDVAPGVAYHDRALMDDERLRRSRFWNEWMAPQDMCGGIGCKVLEAGPSFWFFDVQRGRRQPGFESADVALLQTLVPHLRRAVEINRQLQSTQLLTSTFAHLSFGVILVDGSMRIASLNAAAEAILLRAGSALVSKSGRLAAADRSATVELQRLVAQACSRLDDIVPGVGGSMLVRRKRGSRDADLALSIGPILKPPSPIPFVGPHAAIFIRELSLDLPAGTADQMRTLFALSPKEASLAASLAAGRTLKEAADDNRIQFSTARSYLETIFRKTGTRQQSQLVALLKSVQPLARQ